MFKIVEVDSRVPTTFDRDVFEVVLVDFFVEEGCKDDSLAICFVHAIAKHRVDYRRVRQLLLIAVPSSIEVVDKPVQNTVCGNGLKARTVDAYRNLIKKFIIHDDWHILCLLIHIESEEGALQNALAIFELVQVLVYLNLGGLEEKEDVLGAVVGMLRQIEDLIELGAANLSHHSLLRAGDVEVAGALELILLRVIFQVPKSNHGELFALHELVSQFLLLIVVLSEVSEELRCDTRQRINLFVRLFHVQEDISHWGGTTCFGVYPAPG